MIFLLSTLITHPEEASRAAIHAFAIEGELTEIRPHHRGHIHDTYVSTWKLATGEQRFLHQRMNAEVFRDLPGLMHNIQRVTEHLRSAEARRGEEGSSGPLEALTLVPTRDGKSYLSGPEGAWRTYNFVDGTESYDQCKDPAQARQAAYAFGHFQEALRDLPAEQLHETLPKFFSSPHRLSQFDDALAKATPERIESARSELDFVEAHRSDYAVIEERMASGEIPPRVVHGDTKLNNVLFDVEDGRARCIVDLDTCMPGYSLYDFGDLVRFTAATSSEDERDLAKAGMNLELYRALVDGYLAATRHFLLPLEVELMPFAARLVTLTIGTRFLTDHLSGDVYFKVARPGHNLDRARVQFAMVRSMESQADAMRVE